MARFLALAIWLAVMAGAAVITAHTTLRTDMAAFLPRSAQPAQQALTDQLNHGAAAHLILLGITGAPPPGLAALSENLAARLRRQPGFIDIANGDPASFAGVQDFIWRNRYLLGPADFSTSGLHASLENDLGLLVSDAGGMTDSTLPSDPTGEALNLMGAFTPTQSPNLQDGVWASPDGATALLLVHTQAPGFELDAQQQALTLIGQAFNAARAATPRAATARLHESGPGVFAVQIRDTTKHDVQRLSMLASAGAICLLLFVYRSPRVLLLGLLPVASGALAAVAAVSLRFGFVHGVTLGFGVTLIGESLDYAIYLFTQAAPGERPGATLARIWPTLRLGAATSVAGFGAMLFSSFVGFAQLGLFSITGLVVAAAVTRFVLPQLMPQGFSAPGGDILAKPLLALIARRAPLRLAIAAAVLAATVCLALHRAPLWDGNLNDLSPVPPAAQALDETLRRDLGVADLRYFAVLQSTGEQPALQASEALAPVLQSLVARHALTGFELPSTTLPSQRTQRARQAALPDAATLRARFAQASFGLPFRAYAFAPFFHDIATARTSPWITAASLPPQLALRLQSTLVPNASGWAVIAPLTGVTNPAAIAGAFAAARLPGLQCVDLNFQSSQLLLVFQSDATKLAGIGSLAIFAVLLAGMRSPVRVARIAAPLGAAVTVTAALLTLGGAKLSIFMVVGFLLIIAVGSNYCLFFARPEHDPRLVQRAISAIVLANLCTVSAYGLMSLSSIPVLHDIGKTVAIGTFLSLLFGAVLSTGRARA